MIGAILFNTGRFRESEPWLASVVARQDDRVRPQVMLTSLRRYAKLLRARGESEQAKQVEQRAIVLENSS
jgi:hypothetical protein